MVYMGAFHSIKILLDLLMCHIFTTDTVLVFSNLIIASLFLVKAYWKVQPAMFSPGGNEAFPSTYEDWK